MRATLPRIWLFISSLMWRVYIYVCHRGIGTVCCECYCKAPCTCVVDGCYGIPFYYCYHYYGYSFRRMDLRWNLCTLHLLVCQATWVFSAVVMWHLGVYLLVKFVYLAFTCMPGDSGLCCCNYVTSLEHQLTVCACAYLWQPVGVGGEAALPGALDSAHPTLVPRYLEGQAAVTIQHVACGDLFTACLTGELAPFSPIPPSHPLSVRF